MVGFLADFFADFVGLARAIYSRSLLYRRITADEVAAILRLDRRTVYDYAGRGEIPCRRVGKRLLFSRDAIALWLDSCSKRSSESSSK